MERNESENKKNYWIIFAIIAIIIFTILSVYYFQELKRNINNKELLLKEINSIKETEQKGIKENKDIEKQIENLKNINENIQEEKEITLNNAKILEQKIIKKETNYKIAYLTFDDGPYYNTHKVLDVLKKYKVKATFFTIGLDKDDCYDNKKESCKELYLKEVEEGHTIANHTYSHLIFKGLYTSADSFIEQVKKQEKLIKERTGVTTNIVRFPGGSGTANAYGIKDQAINKLRENGYGWVDWTAQDGDGGWVATGDIAWNNLVKEINEDIEVIVFHDYSTQTLSILPKTIEYLQNKNYILLPLFYDSVKVNK